jgi:PAS domain S-box-containing protein
MIRKIGITAWQHWMPLEKQFERLLRYLKGYPSILLDRDGTILSWNKDFERIEGYTEQEIIGQNFNIFYLPDERQRHLPEELLLEASAKGKAAQALKCVRKDGGTFAGNLILTAIRSSDGEVIGFSESTVVIPEQDKE